MHSYFHLWYTSSHFELFIFIYSDTWRRNFFKRYKFSVKMIGKKVNKAACSEDQMRNIAEYHISLRALQLSQIRHPVFGFTDPCHVMSRDEVPIELTNRQGTTVHATGDECVYDAVGKDSDTKRFCTLNLFGAMAYRADGLNIPRPHLVFKGAFKPGSEWHDEDERKQWDPRVVVSFQENGWVDAKTDKLGLKEVLGPINELLKKERMQGVVIQDNLTSHKAEEVMQFWNSCPSLSEFIPPRFVPPNMTEIVQVRLYVFGHVLFPLSRF
jgi:hypothetical protein